MKTRIKGYGVGYYLEIRKEIILLTYFKLVQLVTFRYTENICISDNKKEIDLNGKIFALSNEQYEDILSLLEEQIDMMKNDIGYSFEEDYLDYLKSLEHRCYD